jgi:phosphohistidine phosphatase SixA
MRLIAALFLAACALLAPRAVAADEAAAWAALRAGGHVALMRHALAPGGGDPAGFRADDCTTQRNLSDAGRDQARAIGGAFRANGVAVGAVLSSAWCRCLETARLLGLGPVEQAEMLNSFFRDRSLGPRRVAAIKAYLSRPRPGPSHVLVTHQVNITGATGVYPRSGEIVVVRPDGGGFTLVGKILIPAL